MHERAPTSVTGVKHNPKPSIFVRALPVCVAVILVAALFPALTNLFGHFNDYMGWARAAIEYPHELDYGEGPILSQVMRLAQGRSIYEALDTAPFTIGNYPPLFHFVSIAVAKVYGAQLASGRLVTVVSTLGIALAVGLLTFIISSRADAHRQRTPALMARASGALVAAGLFISTKPVYFWGTFMRVDMLAVFLSIWGIVINLIILKRKTDGAVLSWPQQVFSVLPFLLAAYTKQSTIAGAAAVFIAIAIWRPRIGYWSAFFLAASGLAVFAVANVLTGGEFYSHLVTANLNSFSWQTTWYFIGEISKLHWQVLVLAVAGAVFNLSRVFSRQIGVNKQTVRLTASLYLVCAFAVSLTVGKVGSSYNYLVEFMAAASMCAGIFIADAFAMVLTAVDRLRTYTSAHRRATFVGSHILATAGALALFAAVTLGLARYTEDFSPAEKVWVPMPNEGMRAAYDQALARIAMTPGPIISEVMTFLPMAGKDIELQPIEFSQLAYQGIWDETPILEAIYRRDFSLVVLGFDVLDDPGWHRDRFTPQMLEAVRQEYVQVADIWGLRFYEPAY